ncbi:MAG: glutamate formimidoyltransferase [Thermoplasmata archaeon]|nr:glutamate formimidoyltransferase [Thermoplasmata archaeon]
MKKIVECVPNFSEGRDKNIIDQIVAEIESVEGSKVVDVDMGADTNRTVVTFFGTPDSVAESAFLAVKKSTELIDMAGHKGAHPRFGATDVCPFIPVSGVTMKDCVDISKKVGARIGKELDIPLYLYEESASSKERQSLAFIRTGEYEGLKSRFKESKLKPDFGPAKFIPKFGAMATGAREFLIAYNVNLNTKDKKYASDIALEIREKGRVKRTKSLTGFYRDGEIVFDKNGKKVEIPGKFKNCRAIGWFIDEYGQAQISINLTNYNVTSVHAVFDEVCKLAQQRGLRVTGSEIVGLVPKKAMMEAGIHYLKKQKKPTGYPEREIIELAVQSMGLRDLSKFCLDEKIVEYVLKDKCRLVDMTVSNFTDEVQTDSVAPGGGSVAALGGALGGGLVAMVSNLSTGKDFIKIYNEICKLGLDAEALKAALIYNVDADTQAFNGVMAANKLPKGTKDEAKIRDSAIQNAYKEAINMPLDTANKCFEVLKLADIIADKGLSASISDVGVGALMAHAGMHGAILNVRINLPSITDKKYNEKMLKECSKLAKDGDALLAKVMKKVEKKL